MQNFEREIEELEKKLEVLRLRREERKKQLDIGVVSIVDDRLKLELLLSEKDFSEEHIEKLTQITTDLQNLLLEVYKDKGEEK